MEFPTAARHNPAAVGQPARLINIFCINLMNSWHQFVYPLDENPPQLLYGICSLPVRKSVIIVQGRERPILFCQFLRPVSHIMLPSLYLADTPVEVRTPCFPQSCLASQLWLSPLRPPGKRRGFTWKSLSGLKTLSNHVQGAGTSLAPPGNECCSQRGALDRQEEVQPSCFSLQFG